MTEENQSSFAGSKWSDLDIEPIHLRSYIQPHAVLLVLAEPNLKIIQASANTASFFDVSPEELLQKSLQTILPKTQISKFKKIIKNNNFEELNLAKFRIKRQQKYILLDGIIHRNPDGLLILELELATSQEAADLLNFYHSLEAAVERIKETANLEEIYQAIAREVKKITKFDRVMVYKFHADRSGEVVAEEKREDLEPYLGLHYPDADTKSCRYLYAENFLRLIVDVNAASIPLIPFNHPENQQPLDLTFSVVRDIAPCHREYLQNMGVQGTLVMSLMKKGELWGMISCHHYKPKHLAYEIRQACKFLGQVMSIELEAKEEKQDHNYQFELKSIETKLTEYISAEENLIDGLTKHQPNLLQLTNAKGAAIVWNDTYTLLGEAPDTSHLQSLVKWLQTNVTEEVFATNSLPHLYPEAKKYKDIASGLLAIAIPPQNYLLWFQPELIQTVNWAGDPHQTIVEKVDAKGTIRLSPRGSFTLWQEIVRFKSSPWKQSEIEAARSLRNSLINIFLRQADELAKLARELETSNKELEKFAYVASHDLQEPLNLVASYVQLLEMRYQDELDADGKEFITYTVEGVKHMQTLIDDLLAYSRVGSKNKEFAATEVKIAFNRALTNLHGRIEESGATITHEEFPTVIGDATQLTQLFQNFIGNAIKFRSEEQPKIHVGIKKHNLEWLFSVKDNGIGIEPEFSDRIFLIFQRLHARDEYPGTGIGLAICKKIVERHGGRIWLESKLGEGAIFYFTIPMGQQS